MPDVVQSKGKGDMMTEAKIVFWDVERGHAAYLQSPNGRHIVIDLGTGSYGSDYEFCPLVHLKIYISHLIKVDFCNYLDFEKFYVTAKSCHPSSRLL